MFARAVVGWSIALPLSVFLTAGASAQNDHRRGNFVSTPAPRAAAIAGPPRGGSRVEFSREESRGGGHDSHRESRSSTSINVSIGASFGAGFRDSWRRDWCDPFPYRPVRYCPPAVVYCPPVTYCPPPVVIERPVVQTTYVVDQPRVVYVDQPTTTVIQPAPVTVQRGFVPAADAETAALYWAGGDASRAIDGLRSYISDRPGSVKEIRLLGLINLDQGRAADAVGYIYQAYNLDPTLADRAFDPAAAGLGAEQFKRMQRSALDYATQNGSPSSWLTVITLLQAQGQRDLAQATMTKAVDAGLSATIVDRFRTALGK